MKKSIVLIASMTMSMMVMADDVAGSSTTYTFVPNVSGANAWSDTARWFDSETASVPFGSTPGPDDDVVFSRPIFDPANPLVWPAEAAVSVKAFNVGDSVCGQAGNYFFSFPSGASFTVNGQSIWARNAGMVVANIEEGATVTFNDMLMLGRTANSSGIITNRGDLTVKDLWLGGFNGSLGQIDVFGTLTVNGRTTIGYGDMRTCGRLVIHKGGTLLRNGLSEAYYLEVSEGPDSVGELVLDDATYVAPGGETIRIGYGKNADGKVLMNGGAFIDYSKGSGYLYAGYGQDSRAEIVMSDEAKIDGSSGCHLYLGYGERSHGILTLSGNAHVLGVGDRDPHLGYGPASRVEVSLSDSAYVRSQDDAFYISEGNASTATVSLAGTSYLQSATYLYIGQGDASSTSVTLSENSSLQTGRSLTLATGTNARGRLRLEGGSLLMRPYLVADGHKALVLGATTSSARLEGWGSIMYSLVSQPIPDITAYDIYMDGGQVVADGAGTDRDLGLTRMIDIGTADSVNASGTNGWYAVNHGRVLFPHVRPLGSDVTFCVGDYHTKTTPDLVNACAVTLVGNSSGGFLHAALYAPDRTDIPSGLVLGEKDKAIGIWRMGYCNGQEGETPGTPFTFTSAALKFRYDAMAAGKGTKYAERYLIETYRYDGTTWQKVAVQENDTEEPYVTLEGLTPYDDSVVPGYNLGWTAIVARYQPPGLCIMVK